MPIKLDDENDEVGSRIKNNKIIFASSRIKNKKIIQFSSRPQIKIK